MPKLKIHKGAQKRIHITGRGKLLRLKIGKSHLRRKKTKRIKRQYAGKTPLSPGMTSRIRELLG
jgi:large subunit ribosomal protein L35